MSSIAQQRALAILPKLTGGLSCCFSLITATLILRDSRKRSKVYHRLVLGMSFADISSSVWLAMSTWPIPEDTGIVWAKGTQTTCTVQGFFTQFGISSPIYNVSLSLYYLLTIRYGWKEVALRKVEVFFHLLPFLWAAGTATAAGILDILHSANLWCWIAPPSNPTEAKPTVTAQQVDIFRWVFFYAPLWLAISIVTIHLLLLFKHVRRVTLKSEKHSYVGQTNNIRTSACVRATTNHDSFYFDQGFFERKPPFRTTAPLVDDPIDDSIKEQIDDPNDDPNDDPMNASMDDSIHDSVDEQAFQMQESASPQTSRVPTNSLPSRTSSSESVSRSRRSILSSTFSRSNVHPSTPQQPSIFAKRRQRVLGQCLRYALAFYATWIPITIVRIMQTIHYQPNYVFFVFAAMCTPLQGAPNFMVYLYPMVTKAQKQYPNRNLGHWIRLSLQNRSSPPAATGSDSVS